MKIKINVYDQEGKMKTDHAANAKVLEFPIIPRVGDQIQTDVQEAKHREASVYTVTKVTLFQIKARTIDAEIVVETDD